MAWWHGGMVAWRHATSQKYNRCKVCLPLVPHFRRQCQCHHRTTSITATPPWPPSPPPEDAVPHKSESNSSARHRPNATDIGAQGEKFL